MKRVGSLFLLLSIGLLAVAAGLFFLYSSGWAWVLFTFGVIFLMLALGDEPFTPADPATQLETMPLVSEHLGTITLASGVLAITDRTDLTDGLRLESVPQELEVRLRLRKKGSYQVIVAVELSGDPPLGHSGSDHVSADSLPVDSGFVYFGDASLFDHGLRPRNLEAIVQTSRTEPGPLQALITDPGGTPRGVLCQSGLGTGLYKVEWVSGDTWRLRCGFA